ncbi:AraC family transcriptional regulator [Saccharibacillus sp. CPCC 101409]|uniref:AraC family transcriptional regulator n=1 Tax=Saccharibacillus sp. CPCC 101409 TaxID=3058041 RepID=UPI002670FC45|nr:AraC family transcriptional regulator [Saccharibacillus sp. CPCC 101409]MDO3408595.1 AraC family transcriptional regulator [Saccharibacillus sp. CPCC 101409]
MNKRESDSIDKKKKAAERETVRLAALIDANTGTDGTFASRIPGLYLNRFSRMELSDYVYTMHWPTVGIAAQGTKTITVGQETFEYSGSRLSVIPVALPVRMQTTLASPAEPFLGVGVYLEPRRIAELVPKVYPDGLPSAGKRSASYMLDAEPELIGAVSRLVGCLDGSDDDGLLASLAIDEIFIRLLRSPIGVYVAETVLAGSDAQRVSKAIAWLQDNFAQSLKIAELAELVHLSESSFREYFKSVTSMSPLQYQKALRLQEARRLMLSGEHDATSACRLVGYISDSQFSRDYSRFFGSPPSRDIARWKQANSF